MKALEMYGFMSLQRTSLAISHTYLSLSPSICKHMKRKYGDDIGHK